MLSTSSSVRVPPGSPCTPALTRGTSPRPTFATIARVLAPLRGRIEFNIEGDPRPDLARAGARGPARPVHARSGHAWRSDEPGRMAGRHPSRPAAADRSAICRRRAFASACSSTLTRRRCAGRAAMGADRIELYTEPFARAFAAGGDAAAAQFRPLHGGGAACASTRASASTPGTISISTISCCSARCRISTKFPSATP